MSLPWFQEGCSCSFSVAVSFSLGLSGMPLKDEQLSAIKAVYEGLSLSVCPLDMVRASATKHCRLLWNTNLVEIELSSLCLPWLLY